MSKKYLDSTGLSYFWGKLKSYFQKKLVSGTNIKTINGQSVLGSGNITVSGGGVEEIFFAEYGETTYQEVEEVYIDGRVIIMKNGPILAQLAQHDEGYEFIFVAYEGEGYYAVYTLDPVEDWNYEGYIIPTSLADLSSDSTHRVVTDTEKSTWNGKSDFSGDYDDLSNKPTLFSGDYDDLTNKPTLFSGDYNDLSNKPTIPTKISDLLNDFYEKGTATAGSVTWTYRKWADGDLEMWGEASTTLAINTASGSIYTTANTYDVAMPSFVNSCDFFTGELSGGGWVDVTDMTNPPKVRFYAPTSYGSTTRYLRYYMKGTWT